LAIGPINCSIEKERHVQVFVRDNNVDQALRALKKKMQREGLFREISASITRNPRRRESGRRQKPFGAPVSSLAKSCSARVYCP
jgi:small subunit ribosomal protein S21